MKRISNSDLLIGLEYPNQEVQKAYLNYALKKWLTSKNYGPQSFEKVMALKELCPSEVYKLFSENANEVLPELIAQTKGIDFAKVDLLLQHKWYRGKIFSYKIAYATLLNLDAYPNAGFNRLPKRLMVEKLQNKLCKIEEIDVWQDLFSLGKLSPSGLKIFSSWLQNQEKEDYVGLPVIRILCDKAKIQSCFAKNVFDISLYLIGNFSGFINEAVVNLDDFCQRYPMFQKPLENFLLKNFDRYFWKLEPFPHRNPLQYYKEMMEHLTSRNLHFSITWKMKIVQKMLNQAKNRASIIYLLDNLRNIYDFQVEKVDEAYFKAIKTGLCKQEISGSDVLNIVNSFANGSLFNATGPWWRKFAEYPLAFQKTMVMVCSSSKVPESYLMQAYFSLVQMNQANSCLFNDFKKLAISILAKKWKIDGQQIVFSMKVFQYSPYSETKFSYIEQGICKLLKIADDKQIEELKGLQNILPFYDKISEIEELRARWSEIEAKQKQQQELEAEQKKEIAYLLAKIH